mmetsp:Transcript_23683/g.42169  ORF Transcript_23683/g.42169 Transcript_23683/m.42169 type:complete len:347 (-) Transcript_23683:390-1430(-)
MRQGRRKAAAAQNVAQVRQTQALQSLRLGRIRVQGSEFGKEGRHAAEQERAHEGVGFGGKCVSDEEVQRNPLAGIRLGELVLEVEVQDPEFFALSTSQGGSPLQLRGERAALGVGAGGAGSRSRSRSTRERGGPCPSLAPHTILNGAGGIRAEPQGSLEALVEAVVVGVGGEQLAVQLFGLSAVSGGAIELLNLLFVLGGELEVKEGEEVAEEEAVLDQGVLLLETGNGVRVQAAFGEDLGGVEDELTALVRVVGRGVGVGGDGTRDGGIRGVALKGLFVGVEDLHGKLKILIHVVSNGIANPVSTVTGLLSKKGLSRILKTSQVAHLNLEDGNIALNLKILLINA